MKLPYRVRLGLLAIGFVLALVAGVTAALWAIDKEIPMEKSTWQQATGK